MALRASKNRLCVAYVSNSVDVINKEKTVIDFYDLHGNFTDRMNTNNILTKNDLLISIGNEFYILDFSTRQYEKTRKIDLPSNKITDM